jgi:hypothetical protein
MSFRLSKNNPTIEISIAVDVLEGLKGPKGFSVNMAKS